MDSELQAAIIVDGGSIRNALEEIPSEPIKELIKEAFRQAYKRAVFAHSDELKQRAGLAGVMMVLKDRGEHDLYGRVEKELRFWKAMGAAASGVPVDFGQVMAEFGDSEDAIGLSDCWNQVMKERRVDG